MRGGELPLGGRGCRRVDNSHSGGLLLTSQKLGVLKWGPLRLYREGRGFVGRVGVRQASSPQAPFSHLLCQVYYDPVCLGGGPDFGLVRHLA